MEAGKQAGEAAFTRIMTHQTRWKNRRIPIYIRRNLMVPWYLVPDEKGELRLFVIQYPNHKTTKVSFIEMI
ncbi:hypothetical protein HNQ92_001517 [Rhabdobacter roseus]|uniref:Uncharacterized protein n=1 Tax=Rhabdobacter roseus TaxID=1655419 RepID=A0A840TJ34_9BACT|nr:hypothetical protein [Rhabdobacter roseus]